MMVSLVAAGLLLLALLLLPQQSLPRALSPGLGIAVLLSALALRAALVASAALLALLAMPATSSFQHLSSWCFHTVAPYFSLHIGLNGHAIGHTAVLVPASMIIAMLASAGFGSWRAKLVVRGWIRSNSIGSGPSGSVIVGGSQVLLATTGIRHPQVVVSAGALMSLDDEELSAGLEHERGHVRRGHQFVALAAVVLYGCCRFLPGTRSILDQLQFQIERDADEYALRRTGDPTSLAGAIFKAASPLNAPGAIHGLGGSDVGDRIEALQLRVSRSPLLTASGVILTGSLVAASAAVLAMIPMVIAATSLDVAAPFGNLFGC